MDPREADALINRISLGARYSKVKDGQGNDVIVVLKDLTLQDKAWVDFIYEQALEDGKKHGLLTESELAVFLEDTGVWTSLDEEDIRNHIIAIQKLNEKLKTNSLSKRDIKKIKSVIASTQRSLDIKRLKRQGHFAGTITRHAEGERIKAIVFCSTYKNMLERYWHDWLSFENEIDGTLIDNLITAIAQTNILMTKQIREIARHSAWRFKWNAAKNSDSLFGKPIVALTRDQENLVYWSQVYDAAYDAYERPSDEIIEDDEALDNWFKEQSRRRKERQATKTTGTKTNKWGLSSNISRHTEIGIVTNRAAVEISAPPSDRGWGNRPNIRAPSTEDVNSLNSELSKKFKEAQRKKLREGKVLREEDMRYDSDSRRMIGEDAVVSKFKRKDGFTSRKVNKKFQGGTLRGRR